MSFRYPSAIVKPSFNPLAAQTSAVERTLFTWGSSNFGELGFGNTTKYSSPKQVGALTNWLTVSASTYSCVVVKTDGTLWNWGRGQAGQLGHGNTTHYSSPKQVGALTDWSSTSIGRFACLAVKTNGTLWSWGNNYVGSLGLNVATYYSSPKQIGALTTWLRVAMSGYGTAYAITTGGAIYSWGSNYYGELGRSTSGGGTNTSSPVQIGALTNWLNMACGRYFVLATKTDGTLWGWGRNQSGQLGLGNTTSYSSPKQIGVLTTWSTVSGASSYSAAITTSGTLYAWGDNSNGQLGLGNRTYYSSPKQIGALTTWYLLANGPGKNNFNIAIKTDGTLWSWGAGASGKLGLGNETDYSSPKQVGSLTTWAAIAGGDAHAVAR